MKFEKKFKDVIVDNNATKEKQSQSNEGSSVTSDSPFLYSHLSDSHGTSSENEKMIIEFDESGSKNNGKFSSSGMIAKNSLEINESSYIDDGRSHPARNLENSIHPNDNDKEQNNPLNLIDMAELNQSHDNIMQEDIKSPNNFPLNNDQEKSIKPQLKEESEPNSIFLNNSVLSINLLRVLFSQSLITQYYFLNNVFGLFEKLKK
jgi:hypothetical protein